ncbi:MAG: prolyl oligopeptidase family serine peptidase [Microthrixaceae bacterium]|nr:prolyl oligopeptidase family serine peptidase [Microthrixaceae bacterium]
MSVCLPVWDPHGRLWWCDDRDDLWLLRCAPEIGVPVEASGDTAPQAGDRDVPPGPGREVGAPRWVSGGARYGFAGEDRFVVHTADGFDSVQATRDDLDGFTEPGWVDTLEVGRNTDDDGAQAVIVAALAGSPVESTAVLCATFSGWAGDPGAGATPTARLSSTSTTTTRTKFSRFHESRWPLPVGSISVPEAITFPTGMSGEAIAHALFYPPKLEGVMGPAGDLPPLVVRIHGGPTASARAELSPSVQYWTTRGFAVVDVNYRGSTGYGRAYRDLLRGGWGEVDVRDCIAAAEFLAGERRVDARRCVIRGGSAGGFTALEAVAAEPTASGFQFAAATTPLRRHRPDGAGERHPQVRVALPGRPHRTSARGRGGLPAAFALESSGADLGAGADPAGPGGPGGSTVTGRGAGGGAACRRHRA